MLRDSLSRRTVGGMLAYAGLSPAQTLPSPSGRYPVGRASLHCVDARRADPAANEAQSHWDRLRRQATEPEGFEKHLTEIRAADLRFVLHRLTALNLEAHPLRGRLDLNPVGVFGHSRGGRSAARACQLDHRFRACLNQDGNMRWQPFWLAERGASMRQPFLMLDHLDLARHDLPADGKRAARQAEARGKFFQTFTAGSYHVTLRTPGVSHNSFLDIPLLGRPDSAGINLWPEAVRAATPHGLILQTIQRLDSRLFSTRAWRSSGRTGSAGCFERSVGVPSLRTC